MITRVSKTPTERPNIKVWIAKHAYHLAVADIGKGEEGSNNDGPWLVSEVRPNDGTRGEADTEGPWCASWVSYCYTRALSHAVEFFEIPGLLLGFSTSRSAGRLGENMSRAGWIILPEEAREGDVFFKKRTGGNHTGFIRGPLGSDGRLPTLEGNVGKFPAVVKPLKQDPSQSGFYIVRYA